MSSYNHLSRSLLRPAVAQTLGGVVVGAATVLLLQRWLAARVRAKAAQPVVVADGVVVETATAPAPAARKRARPVGRRARRA